jgi:hypothetical protein
MRHNLFLGVAVAALAVPAAVSAQETTSAIAGQVTDESGAPVAGAKVIVVHTPSGTTATSTTDATGSFALRGLRVGGPYVVKVDSTGYPEQTVEGLSLTLGDTLGLPVQLHQKDIVVTGKRSGSRQLVEGSQSAFNASQIQDIVSARRDVRDIVRRDPLASYNPNTGGVSIAGGNIRTQRFSIDGVQMQDSFGLNYGGLPSTRGIVSIEAIDQLTVKAAPYDISEGNFQGGAVNVVLKSGTNHFHVSAFGDWGGPSLTGKLTRDNRGVVGDNYPVNPSTVLPFKNYGGSISGPIIKDHLFLSLAYEYLSEGAANTYGVAGSGAANIAPGLTQAQVDNIINVFNTAGYNPYNVGNIPTTIAEKDKKYSGKLDWNIVEGQRLSLSYIFHKNVLPNFATGASTGSNSASAPYIQLQSDQYQVTELTKAYSGQLNSQWTDKLSSEVRVAYKYYKRGQDPYFGPDYAQFNVCSDATSVGGLYPTSGNPGFLCTTGNGIVRLGPDTPRQANQFNNKQLTATTNLQLRAGDHTFKLEADYMHSRIYNLFSYGGTSVASGLTGGGSGAYYFDSVADFTARQANEYTLTTATTGTKNDAYVNWAYQTYTFGLQDTWRPSSKLTANAGVRFDMDNSTDRIAVNPNFLARYSTLYPGITNTGTLNGRAKLQPRAGFNWAPEPSIRISGGVGLFAGGLSDVFISNNYSNSGVAINGTGATVTGIDIVRTGGTAAAPTCLEKSSNVVLTPALCAAALNNVAGGSVPTAIADYIRTNAGVAANALTNSLDPHFRLPAQWKYNLSGTWKPHFGDSELASGWSFRGDALYSKVQEAVRWTDLRAQPLVANGVVQVAPDGRPRYGANVGGAAPGSNYDIQLTNTSKGAAWVFSGSIIKELEAFTVSAGYTHQNVKDVAGVLTSSTVSSTYGVPTSDPNSGGDYGRSAFETTHTIRGNIDFKHNFFGDNQTRFGINWELRSGQPFSVVMNDFGTNATTGRAAVFGTVNTQSHLLYVPNFGLTPVTNASTTQGVTGTLTQYGNVIFADAATLASVQALVNGTALKNYQGRIAPKNLLTGPWYNKVDLNLAQQVPFFFHSKFTALFSIENFLNLLNRNWGTYQDFGGSATVLRVACQTPAAGNAQTCPNYIYSTYSAPKTSTLSKPSLYAIRAGVRFDF